jgi:hypothetical protein
LEDFLFFPAGKKENLPKITIAHSRDGRDSRFADAGGIAERVAFCRYN